MASVEGAIAMCRAQHSVQPRDRVARNSKGCSPTR
ncbi:hypothetical protein ACWCQS_43325 [Streptomyces sp. NPDC002076]